VGAILLTGAGAGMLPTASSVVSDVVSLARQLATGNPKAPQMGFFSPGNRAELVPIDELETEFYLRLTAVDKPGVLAKVTAVLGEEGISIRALVQKPEHDPERVPVIFLTHATKNSNVRRALKRIDALDIIQAPTQVLRFYR
jgi:homoserine dehydrogenase